MKFRSLLFAGAAAAALAVPGAASAQETDDTSITLNAGTLTISDEILAGDFPNTTLTGLVQVVNAGTDAWSVNDARGSLLGWNVKMKATQFSTGGVTPVKLPAGSLSYVGVDALDISAGADQLLGAPLPLGAAAAIDADDGSGEKGILHALASTGVGEWDIAAKASALSLVIPAEATPGTYTSTITTTLSTGALS